MRLTFSKFDMGASAPFASLGTEAFTDSQLMLLSVHFA
jgi:hypothetical protein